MKFWLGTHQVQWLGTLDVSLFVSRRRLTERKTLPRARQPWALDSGGFSELLLHGHWGISPEAYALEVRRYQERIGQLSWAAAQDSMCEEIVCASCLLHEGVVRPDQRKLQSLLSPLLARSSGKPLSSSKVRLVQVKACLPLPQGLWRDQIARHQKATIANYLRLTELAPDLPWVPVLQGYQIGDYLDHLAAYREAGVDLRRLPLVGVGSICRRQGTREALELLRALSGCGLRLHGFGFKIQGLEQGGAAILTSADSMAWSYEARRQPPLPDCRDKHKNCANCALWAIRWRTKALGAVRRGLLKGIQQFSNRLE